jgi:hypothetical protein
MAWRSLQIHHRSLSVVLPRVPGLFPSLYLEPIDQGNNEVDPDRLGIFSGKTFGRFAIVFDALDPVHAFHGSIVYHGLENVVPTSGGSGQ